VVSPPLYTHSAGRRAPPLLGDASPMIQGCLDFARHDGDWGVWHMAGAIGVSTPQVPMGDDRPQLRASPVRDRCGRPPWGDGMLNRCSPCTKPRVIPSGARRLRVEGSLDPPYTIPCCGAYGCGVIQRCLNVARHYSFWGRKWKPSSSGIRSSPAGTVATCAFARYDGQISRWHEDL